MNKLHFLKNANRVVLARAGLVVAGAVGVVSQAHAALDPAVATTLTTVQTDGTAILPLLYPVMAAITGGFVIFGLVKKGIRKVA